MCMMPDAMQLPDSDWGWPVNPSVAKLAHPVDPLWLTGLRVGPQRWGRGSACTGARLSLGRVLGEGSKGWLHSRPLGPGSGLEVAGVGCSAGARQPVIYPPGVCPSPALAPPLPICTKVRTWSGSCVPGGAAPSAEDGEFLSRAPAPGATTFATGAFLALS